MIKIYYKSECCTSRAMILDNGNLPESITENGDYHTIEFEDWKAAKKHADDMLKIALASKNANVYQL